MILQVLLVIGMVIAFCFAWTGVDQSKAWKIVTGGVIALGLFAVSCSVGPKRTQYEDCTEYSRWADDC